jgi:hypothetical protein
LRELDRSGEQIALDNFVDDAGRQRGLGRR